MSKDLLDLDAAIFVKFAQLQKQISQSFSTPLIFDYFDHEMTQLHDLLSEIDDHSQISSLFESTREEELILTQKRSNRPHVSNRRKKRGQKSPLQQACENGYWTKNFLPVGKNPHFKFIVQKMGASFINENYLLREIRRKRGISMEDYLVLYQMPALRQIWKEFFTKRVLYRELMLTRTEKLTKIICEKFLYRYQESYESGVFNHIA